MRKWERFFRFFQWNDTMQSFVSNLAHLIQFTFEMNQFKAYDSNVLLNLFELIQTKKKVKNINFR